MGFGGSCFRKDILNLVYLCQHFQLDEVARFWEQVIVLNDYQVDRFVNRILKALFNTLVDKKIALFGFAFKPDTGDTRDSPAIAICKKLLQEKASLSITDPHALPNAEKELAGTPGDWTLVEDPYQAASGAHCVALVTEWQQFKDLDYQKIYDSMEKPAFIFDGRNLLDHQALFDIGFNVHPLGKPALSHI